MPPDRAVLSEAQTTLGSNASIGTNTMKFLRVRKHLENILQSWVCVNVSGGFHLVKHRLHSISFSFVAKIAVCPLHLAHYHRGLELSLRVKLNVVPLQPLGILF